MIRSILLSLIAILGALPLASGFARANQQNDDTLGPPVNEQVLSVPVGGTQAVMLQVTVFKPDGPGPFPVAVLNHGKDVGDPRDAPRYRSAYAAHYFVSRGYAVVLPMMRGFAGSGGQTWVTGCDVERMGLEQARDIRDVIQYLPRSAIGNSLDMKRVVMFGQSMGGWNTLAAGALNIPGVRGLVNFAGGVQAPNCPGWELDLAIAAGHYAWQTKVPSIWFYGDNDAKFSVSTWRSLYERYTAGGGQVELLAYGRFMQDSHNFLGKVEALPIWVPKVDAFLRKIGLPSQNLRPELLPASYPRPTHFATIDDVNAVPLVNDKGRQDYRAFLTKEMPRVFAIAPDGTSVSTNGGYDPLDQALKLCQKYNHICLPYAVDDEVVWPVPTPVPPPTHFAAIDNVAAVPYLNDASRQRAYQKFLALPKPRAFAIAPDGAWAYSARGFDPLKQALEACQQKHAGCRLYAVDDQVVWPGQ